MLVDRVVGFAAAVTWEAHAARIDDCQMPKALVQRQMGMAEEQEVSLHIRYRCWQRRWRQVGKQIIVRCRMSQVETISIKRELLV